MSILKQYLNEFTKNPYLISILFLSLCVLLLSMVYSTGVSVGKIIGEYLYYCSLNR